MSAPYLLRNKGLVSEPMMVIEGMHTFEQKSWVYIVNLYIVQKLCWLFR